jgi:hypothetical protein
MGTMNTSSFRATMVSKRSVALGDLALDAANMVR